MFVTRTFLNIMLLRTYYILKIILFSFYAISSNGLVASLSLEAVVDKHNFMILFMKYTIIIDIIHCTHYLSSHWLRAYS